MLEPVGLSLRLPSRTDSVGIVRAAISGLQDASLVDAEFAADLKTAVSEACNNVCLHAYPEGEIGPLYVDIECFAHRIEARVRDRGLGMRRVSSRRNRMGFGLAIINSLADRSGFASPEDGGTEVRICFERESGVQLPADAANAPSPNALGDLPDDASLDGLLIGGSVLWCTPAELQRPVLARVLAYSAVSAAVTATEADLTAANQLIAREVLRRGDGWIAAGIESASALLRVTVGPLAPPEEAQPDLAPTVVWLSPQASGSPAAMAVTIPDRPTS